MTLQVGCIFLIDPGRPSPPGHEQTGLRPFVVVADPTSVHPVRFPLLVVAPLTRARLPRLPLYPRLASGAGGLPAASTVLLDHLLSVDVARARRSLGRLSPAEYAPIRDGLSRLFGLSA
jgi:mRNA interferase MazF